LPRATKPGHGQIDKQKRKTPASYCACFTHIACIKLLYEQQLIDRRSNALLFLKSIMKLSNLFFL